MAGKTVNLYSPKNKKGGGRAYKLKNKHKKYDKKNRGQGS